MKYPHSGSKPNAIFLQRLTFTPLVILTKSREQKSLALDNLVRRDDISQLYYAVIDRTKRTHLKECAREPWPGRVQANETAGSAT